MPGIFGTNPKDREVSNENPLGLDRSKVAHDEGGQPQGNGSQGNADEQRARQFMNQAPPIPDNQNQGQPQTQQRPQPNYEPPQQSQPRSQTQPQPQQTQQEPQQEPQQQSQPEPQVSSQDDMERKIKYITEKFDGGDDLEKSMVELGNKLGENIDPTSFNTTEEVVNKYIELEEELGRRGNQQNQQQTQNQRQQQIPNQEELLRRENQTLKAIINNLNQAGVTQQNPQQPQPQQGQFNRDQQGRFQAPLYNQQNPQQNPQQPQTNDNREQHNMSLEEVTQKYMDEVDKKDFWNKPEKVIANLSAKIANDIAENKINETMQKQQAQRQQEEQTKKLYNHVVNQVEEVKQKYGEQNFKAVEDEVDRYLRNNQYLMLPEFGNGIEFAYQKVMNMKRANQRQNQAQQYNQKEQFRKKNADINNSNADMIPGNQNNQMSQVQKEKQMIFGQPKGNGIFG